MKKVLLIDDEKDALEVLEWKLMRYIPNIEVKKINSPLKALDELPTYQPDIVFLDIQMPEMDGFTFLENLEERNFKLVFTTAFDEYALQAIKVSVLDYLLKPVDKDELIEVFNKLLKEEEIGLNGKFDKLQKELTINNSIDKISISADGKIYLLQPNDVVMLKSDKSYTSVFLTDGKEIIVSKTLKEVEQKFEYPNFYRVHNSFLINLNHIREYVKSDGGEIHMTNGLRASISRTKKKEFIEILSA